MAVDASGQWLASASRDGTARVWQVATGRCMQTWQLGSGGLAVAWCPDRAVRIVSAVTRDRAILLPFGAQQAELLKALQPLLGPEFVWKFHWQIL